MDDLKHLQCRAPRTLQTSKFGPHATLHVGRQHRVSRFMSMAATAVAIGVLWYVCFVVGVTR